MAQFPTLESAAGVVQQLVRSGTPFMRLELLDDLMIEACNIGISRKEVNNFYTFINN
jgi:hypothetical protein